MTAPWQPREITMKVLDGREMTGIYYPHEVKEFERMRAAGMPDDEIRFLHELKATFDATLDIEAPTRRMVALIDEREHFRERNTSSRRVVRTFEQHQREQLAEEVGCLTPTMCDLAGCRGLCRDRQAEPEPVLAGMPPVQESLL